MDPGHNRDRGWNIAISPHPSSVIPGICELQLRLEWIDHPGAGALEMADVPGHHGEAMDDRGGGDQEIGIQGYFGNTQPSCGSGDGDCDRKNAVAVAAGWDPRG